MTATLDTTTTAAQELENLAHAYLNETLPKWEIHQAVDRIAHPELDPDKVWDLFKDLAHWVELRDDFDRGRIHWSAVCGELTGPDYENDAANIAHDNVTDAVRALLHPRSAR